MSYHITIDGGTTNTRISLTKDEKILSTIKISLGAFSSLDNKDGLKNEIKASIDSLLKSFSVEYEDVEYVLASGMITSEFGICPIDHIMAPAGLEELGRNVKRTMLQEICPIPFMFVRGVKFTCETPELADMMRGEETELMGIIRSGEDCVYILPGSHSKVIKVNSDGKIERFSTLLTGEMIKAISEGTILKDAIDLGCDKTDSEYLLKGYEFCREHGVNKALFKVRILKNVFSATSVQTYSFFLGVVLADEIREVEKYDAKKVVIGGRRQLREATAQILKNISEKEIEVLSEEDVSTSVTKGLFEIYRCSLK